MKQGPTYWNLYWVESDGFEDCFVIARNSYSARRVEMDMNGFNLDDVRATKIMRIPKVAEHSYRKQHNKREDRSWPGYAYDKKFFASLGAEFRKIEQQEEMLLCDVVYAVDEYVPCSMYKRRSIGLKAATELRELPELDQKYDEEDIWLEPEIHLITALGMCLARCQLIEHYITESFLFGISKKQKQKYSTINDLKMGWKKKTLGNMLATIEEAWEINPIVKENLELFLRNRNLLIHGLTTDDRYDIRTRWGQLELWAFLSFFDVHSRIVKKAFRASYFSSIHFAVKNWGLPKGFPKKVFSKEQNEEMGLFFECFTPKYDCM